MSDRELEQKFLECAGWGGVDVNRARQIVDLVWRIEKLGSVRELTGLLGASPK